MITRGRIIAAIAVAIGLSFFFLCLALGVVSVSVRTPTTPRSSATAAGPTLEQLASADYGKKQAATHLALVKHAPIVPFIRTLKVGSHDDAGAGRGAVWYLQRALIKEGIRPARDKPTGSYGAITARQVAAFQIRTKVKPTSGVYGPATHHQLQPYYDLAGRQALQKIAHARTQQGYFNRIQSAAGVAWKHRTSMAYSQSFTRAFLPALPDFPRATDCSGYATWLFKVSGLPDPSGFGYRIVGYTGTLAQHGTRISANAAFHVGDLVFYGGGYPYGHVAIVVNAFLRTVSSHGSPGIKVVPFNYRPVSAVRRYF